MCTRVFRTHCTYSYKDYYLLSRATRAPTSDQELVFVGSDPGCIIHVPKVLKMVLVAPFSGAYIENIVIRDKSTPGKV